MIFHALASDWLESSEAHVQRNFGGFDSAGAHAGENLWGEMQAGGGSCDRSALSRIHRLVAFAIGARIFAGDVRRQRNVADLFYKPKKILYRRETDAALAKAAARDHLGLKFIVVSEKEIFSDPDLSSRAQQTLPFVGVGLQLPGKEDFDASVKKIAGGGIARAYRLGTEAAAAAMEARGKDASVVR